MHGPTPWPRSRGCALPGSLAAPPQAQPPRSPCGSGGAGSALRSILPLAVRGMASKKTTSPQTFPRFMMSCVVHAGNWNSDPAQLGLCWHHVGRQAAGARSAQSRLITSRHNHVGHQPLLCPLPGIIAILGKKLLFIRNYLPHSRSLSAHTHTHIYIYKPFMRLINPPLYEEFPGRTNFQIRAKRSNMIKLKLC